MHVIWLQARNSAAIRPTAVKAAAGYPVRRSPSAAAAMSRSSVGSSRKILAPQCFQRRRVRAIALNREAAIRAFEIRAAMFRVSAAGAHDLHVTHDGRGTG